MRAQTVFSLSILLTGLHLAACDDSNDPQGQIDDAAQLVAVWNSDVGEASTLAGKPLAESSIVSALPEAARAEIIREAYPRLLQGCYASSLRITDGPGTSDYMFLRSKHADNEGCSTFVAERQQHQEALSLSLECDFQSFKAPMQFRSNASSSIPQWDPAATLTLSAWLEQHCAPVKDQTAHRLDVGAPCTTTTQSAFVCEVGTTCTPYTLANDEKSAIGLCTEASPDDALLYAIAGPQGFRVTGASVQWPYELQQKLYGDTSFTSNDWDDYWHTVLNHAPSLYVRWEAPEEASLTLFRGRSPENSMIEAEEATLVHIQGTDEQFLSCKTLQLPSESFDSNGKPVDLEALSAHLSTQCERFEFGAGLKDNQACPAIEDSPFHCASPEQRCEAFHASWLGACVSRP